MAVDEIGGIDFHLFFKADKGRWILHTIDLSQQFGPEQLALAFLVALALPALGKTLGSLRNLFLGLVHIIEFVCKGKVSAFPVNLISVSKENNAILLIEQGYSGTPRARAEKMEKWKKRK